MNLRKSLCPVCIMLGWLLVPEASICLAKEKQLVTISYLLKPTKSLPDDVKTVAVIDAGVESIDGIKGNRRERKWSNIAAEMIEAMIQGAPQDSDRRLTVVQRNATRKILEERDLQLVGIVEGDAAAKAGQLLAANGLIMSRISINVDTRRQSKSSIDWMGLLGGGAPPDRPARDPRFRRARGPRDGNPYGRDPGPLGGGMNIPMRDVEEISRLLTVQCSFVLVDTNGGAAVLKYSPPPYQKTDKAKPNFLFGGSIEEGDLDPVDMFIGELVERAAREFVGMMVPVTVTQTYEVIGRGKFGEAAVRALRADNHAEARAKFEAARNDDPEEHETVFALGVTCELLGDFQKALACYREAASMKGVDEDDELPMYLSAKDRLTAHLDRIIR